MTAAAPIVGGMLGHYRVLEQIGAGSMGVVFRCRDQSLDREVAIKVLPPGVLADDSARRQFRLEARALAKLNDPHIAAIYDLATEQDLDYLVLEYVPGVSLREHLSAGPLDERTFVKLSLQLVAGIAAAHRAGIAHGDMKSENVRVTQDGMLKILDFGLAKLLAPAEQDSVETASMSQRFVGTLAYMAPEQLRGESADTLSDIYSLGTVMYEMATGQLPFPEKQTLRLIQAIQHEEPAKPSSIRRASRGVEAMILKALEKDRKRRYQSADEMAVDLKRLSVANSQTTQLMRAIGITFAIAIAIVLLSVVLWRGKSLKPSVGKSPRLEVFRIAVLPFENLGAKGEDEYVADGLADEVSALLSRVQQLQVISRMSVTRFKNTSVPTSEIGRELGVAYLVRGSVQKADAQVKITVAVLNADKGTQLWARTYDRDFRNILTVENEVSEDIVQSLISTFRPDQYKIVSTPPTENPDAFDQYLRGKSLVSLFNNRGSEAVFKQAEEALRAAISIDPGMAAAYAERSRLYYFHDIERARGTPDRDRARLDAEKALAIDPKQPRALASLAMLYSWSGEDQRSYGYAKRIVALNPFDSFALMSLGSCYRDWGLFDEALNAFRKAGTSDPLYIYPATNAAIVLGMMGQLDQAWAENEKAAELESENWGVLLNRIWIRYHQGRLQDAERLVNEAADRLPAGEKPIADLLRSWILSKRGKHAEAREILRVAGETPIVKASINFEFVLAEGFALENMRDESLQILNKTTQKMPMYPWLQRDENLDSLRQDPRFQALLASLKKDWDNYRVRFANPGTDDLLH